MSALPVGALAGAFVAIATTAAQAESARVAASPSSADPVQLVPVEVGETPPVVPQAASAQPQAEEPVAVEPQVAQSGEGDAEAEAEQEPEAFPPETLTDRAGIETLSDVVRYAVLNFPNGWSFARRPPSSSWCARSESTADAIWRSST